MKIIFFVAKPEFWKTWLEKWELISNESEANIGSIAKEWNKIIDSDDSTKKNKNNRN
jgi:hypothetical protein